jgi:hypothetical protein
VVINADAWPSQLEAVLATDHERLRHLLVEAGGATDTLGVRSELARVFAGEVAAHLAAEDEVLNVLHPDPAGSAAPADDELQHAASGLAAAPGDQAVLSLAASAFERHVSLHQEQVLPWVRDNATAKQLAVLAERFGKAREAAPRRGASARPPT